LKIEGVINEQVKIQGKLPSNSKIILTDLSNFDALKHQIKIDTGAPITSTGSKE
jgi:hypothetical protein